MHRELGGSRILGLAGIGFGLVCRHRGGFFSQSKRFGTPISLDGQTVWTHAIRTVSTHGSLSLAPTTNETERPPRRSPRDASTSGKASSLVTINSRAYFQILGAGAPDLSPSFLLFFDNKRYLFNCGEGTQRFCMENKIRLLRLTDLFCTQMHIRNLGGFPGMIFTLADTGALNLNIHGPVGMSHFVDSIKSIAQFFVNYGYSDTHFTFLGSRRSLVLRIHEYSDSEEVFSDENIRVHAVRVCEGTADNTSDGHPTQSTTDYKHTNSQLQSFIIQTNDVPGKFDLDKAVELGVPRGPLFRELKKGNAVRSENGNMVYPHECVEPSTPGSIVVLVDCPSIHYIKQIIENKTLQQYQTHPSLVTVVHVAPEEVLETSDYKQWMMKFNTRIQQIVTNETHCDHRAAFPSATRLVSKLHRVDPEMFPLLYSSGQRKPLHDTIPYVYAMAGASFQRVILQPQSHIGLENDQETPQNGELTQRPKGLLSSPDFPARLEAYKKDIPKYEPLPVGRSGQFSLLFLGTGSAIPSKYRNVTGIYLRYASGFSVLFDGGEGSYGQFARRYTPDGAKAVIQSLNCVFVSHIHADHHIGLIKILTMRNEESIRKTGSLPHPLVVIGPYLLNNWLMKLQVVLGELNYKFIDSSDLTGGNHDWLKQQVTDVGISSIKTVPVPHCLESYGVVIKHNHGPSVVYSGDTRVSEELIEAGKGCTVLIHDSTFEDDRTEEAYRKNHSTVSQAIDVGRRMGVQYTILTHFSQRYPKIPIINDSPNASNHVGIAFDLLELTEKSIPRLAAMMPCVQALFTQEEKSESE